MREVRKKQKAVKKQSARSPMDHRPLMSSDYDYPSKKIFVISSSSSGSSAASPSPLDDSTSSEQSSSDRARDSSRNTVHPQSQAAFHVCSQCMKPIQRNMSIPHDGDADVCYVDHSHWSGLMLAKRRPEPIYKCWLSLGDTFSAAGIGMTLGPGLQESLPHFFRQFTIFNSVVRHY